MKKNETNKYKFSNETDFIRKMRSLKTYCPRSYKDLIFNTNKKELSTFKNGRYSKKIYTSPIFETIYGEIKLVFSVNEGTVLLEDLEPKEFLLDGYFNLLNIYKGIPYRNEKDKFKIDLMLKIGYEDELLKERRFKNEWIFYSNNNN